MQVIVAMFTSDTTPITIQDICKALKVARHINYSEESGLIEDSVFCLSTGFHTLWVDDVPLRPPGTLREWLF